MNRRSNEDNCADAADIILRIPISSEALKGFGRYKKPNPDIYPVLAIKDLNNTNIRDVHDCNPEKPALFIGLKVTF